MPLRTGLRILPLALVAALAAIAFAGVGTAAARSCSDIQLPGRGYIIGITAKNVGCKSAKSVARAHFRKRLDRGGWDGKYNGNVKGYSCRESDRRKTSTELNARVRCTDGSKRISFVYQSNR